ncbi:zinc finger, RING/FYVE/PHD-type [Artemisia annua]|uniref:Zinc finger, RING/FYVE/PHD-type n=1 Tax=Artemisia annua TaxID=35608 RepID=A0A2U1NTC5_ARTAN|nr:zinc finger, RING/FYVE/PHD-type [Artemisia annua]
MSPIMNAVANKNKAIVASSSDSNPTQATVNEPRSQQAVANDSTYSDLMQQFQFSVLDKWRKKMDAEVQKRAVLEERLKVMKVKCKFYAQQVLTLEEALKESEEVEELSAPIAAGGQVEEEVQSKFHVECDALCRVCKSQRANIVWTPCRHLSVCMSCDSHVSRCPICNVKRSDSFRVSWDDKPEGYQGVFGPKV